MWHMPGHIYSRLKRWSDAVHQQEASARVDHQHMMRYRIMPERIHNYAHNNAWLAENLGHLGDADRAVDIALNLTELPRRPKFRADGNGEEVWDAARTAFSAGRDRLLKDLPTFERWRALLDIDARGHLDAMHQPPMETRRLHAVGLAHFNLGHTGRGAETIAALEAHRGELRLARFAAADKAEEDARADKKKQDDIDKAVVAALKQHRKHLDAAEHALAELRLLQRLAAGATDSVREDIKQLKSVPKIRQAAYALRAGDTTNAVKWAREATKNAKNQCLPHAAAIDILQRAGEEDDARGRFEALREFAADLDLSLPPARRLAPLAKSYGWPEDWRLPRPPADDTGPRPPLDELGPFRWGPVDAPDWSLPDREGHKVRLADYRDGPVLVIFYLGHKCVHCMEQLNAFAPEAAAFGEAGIPIVAISTDSPDGLRLTFDKVSSDAPEFPFTIVADPSHKHFKAYRAYDDFEDTPLHGTFLIDGRGRIRWQDISYEPFMHPDFLLAESKRLLALDID